MPTLPFITFNRHEPTVDGGRCTAMHKGMVVEEVLVSSIRTKFRLRTPDEEKIREIATSISFCGLINPVSITSDGWLLAGYHRWKAFELLGYATIPAVIHDENELRGELVEVEENLTRNELNCIEVAEHIQRREQLLTELGMIMPLGGNQHNGKGKLTSNVESLGMSRRTYDLNRSIINIIEEVRDVLEKLPTHIRKWIWSSYLNKRQQFNVRYAPVHYWEN